MKNKTLFFTGVLPLLAFIALVGFSLKPDNNEIEQPNKVFNEKYSITPISIPENVFLAGEKVPTENFDVLESLDRELLINTYWQSQTLIFIKKANRYFPVIEPILKKEGVPTDFKYLALAESGLANVVSPSKAAGFWQFLAGTAKDYGLEVNSEIDERYHLEKATKAAANFLKDSYEKYGTWAMAAASYNTGRRSISKQIERQKSKYYYDLVLGEETGRYVYRIVALKLILESPEKFGFNVTLKEKYSEVPFTTVTVDSSIASWSDFAHAHRINYKILKELNPWLRDNKLMNSSSKQYEIKIAGPEFRNIRPNPEFYPEDSLLIK